MNILAKYNTPLIFFMVLTVFLLSSGIVLAQGRESNGESWLSSESVSVPPGEPASKLQIAPGLVERVEYNDNIFLKHHKNDDVINFLTPSLNILYNAQDPIWSMSGGYAVNIATYSDYGKNNYQTHKPFVSFRFKTPVNLYGGFDDIFTHTADPYGTDEHYGEGITVKRSGNKANLVLGYEFSGHLSIEGLYENKGLWFGHKEDQWQNRDDNKYGASLIYKLTPKTSTVFRYVRTNRIFGKQNDGIDGWDSNTSADHTNNEFMAGFSFDPKGKLSGDFMIGYENQLFYNDRDKDGYTYKNFSSWVTAIDVTFKATPKTQFNLKLERNLMPSNIVAASSFIDTYFELGYSQKILRSIMFSLAAGWDLWEYNLFNDLALPEKKLDTYSVKTGIDYMIREWLSAGVQYEFQTRKATNDQYVNEEYDNNIVSMSLKAVF